MNIYQNVHIISVLLMFQAAFFLVLDDEPQFYDRVSRSFLYCCCRRWIKSSL